MGTVIAFILLLCFWTVRVFGDKDSSELGVCINISLVVLMTVITYGGIIIIEMTCNYLIQ